jgi:large subunit ribosomal protein L10
MPKKEKVVLVEGLTDKLKSLNGLIVTEYQGLTVSEISELRAKLRPHKSEYKVIKNTLSKIALKACGLEEFSNNFHGPTALVIENGDPVATAKVLISYSKDHAKLKLKAGLLGSKVLNEKEIRTLAELPSREVLIAKLLGTMNAPVSNLVNVLSANTRNLVYVLNAIKNQKSQ